MVVSRFDEHDKTQRLLPDQQFAYRATYSTETAIIAVHDSIVRAIDPGDVCALVLLDLSSTFDSVDHETLMGELQQRFGVDGPALTWFGPYCYYYYCCYYYYYYTVCNATYVEQGELTNRSCGPATAVSDGMSFGKDVF